MTVLRSATYCLALLLGLSPGAAGQEEAAVPPGLFEAIDVQVVNVEVYVTDRDGEPVHGLTGDDFVVEVDRRPVAITNFYSVRRGAPVVGVGPPQGVTGAPHDPGAWRLEAQRLHLILYVDNFHLKPRTRNRTLAHVRTFLRTRLRPDDEVMLVTHDRSLRVRHPFSRDTESIVRALYELETMTGSAVLFEAERRELLEAIDEAPSLPAVAGRVNALASSRVDAMRSTLDALGESVDTLAGLPGRKALLYVSDGLPMRPAQDVYQALHERFGDTGILAAALRNDLSRSFQDLTDRANANRVTFYTLEAAGLRSYTYTGAESAAVGGGAKIDQVLFSNLRSPLLLMAKQTGGLAITNTNNQLAMLERVARDFANYYSLGFSPPVSERERFHRIEVKLRRRLRGATLRHREGYGDRSAVTRMADATRAALHFGYQRNPIGLRVVVGEAEPQEGDDYAVPVVVHIPMGALSFIPHEDLQRARVRLFVGALDTEGGLSPVQDMPIAIEVPAARFEAARQQSYEYALNLRMRRGPQVLAIAVRDEIGGGTSSVSAGLRVGS